MPAIPDPFAARDTLTVGEASYAVYRLDALGTDLERQPVTIKVLLENVLRGVGRGFVTEADVKALSSWTPNSGQAIEVPFMPGRVVLQDFTGVPCVVDLAAMRDAMTEMGGDPSRINPLVPADMVIATSILWSVTSTGVIAQSAFEPRRPLGVSENEYEPGARFCTMNSFPQGTEGPNPPTSGVNENIHCSPSAQSGP